MVCGRGQGAVEAQRKLWGPSCCSSWAQPRHGLHLLLGRGVCSQVGGGWGGESPVGTAQGEGKPVTPAHLIWPRFCLRHFSTPQINLSISKRTHVFM